MEPYYDKDGIIIYHGDCRDILPSLGVSADLVLVDIPYGAVNRESGGLRNLDKGDADSITFSHEFAAQWSCEIGMSSYIWCGTEQVSDIRKNLVERGMSTRLCVWEKTNPSPMNGEHLWLSAIEACVFARKPTAFFSEHCKSPVWRGPSESAPVHPTQKPLWLFRKLINASCPAGGLVVDFCFGSGTTLRAAKDLGCRAIGIETNKEYCEIAVERLRQGVLPLAV